MGEQVVSEQDRLGALEVGVAGQVDVADLQRPLEQHHLEIVDRRSDSEEFAFAPQTQVRRHLVVPTPGGVQLPAGRAGELGDPSFDGGVDVLVAGEEHELPGLHLDADVVERGEDRITLVSRQESDPCQPLTWAADPAMSSRHIRRSNGQAHGVGHQRLGGATGEAAVPEGLAVVAHVIPTRKVAEVIGE